LISSKLAPTAAQRGALEGRRNELVDGISGPTASREAGAVMLKRVLDTFDAWPTVRMDAEKAAGVARTYATQLEHLPMWAVDSGIAECQRRNNPFPPSAGELRAACETKISAFQAEIADLNKILTAEVYTPNTDEDRKRVLTDMPKLMKDIGGTNGVSAPLRAADYRETPDAAAVRQLEEFDRRRNLGVDHTKPITASCSLLSTLSRRNER
jgi:hypothetical protein